MNQQETSKIIYVIKATYPAHYARYSNEDLKNMVLSWSSILEDVPYSEVSTGLKAYIRTDTKGFPPTPGQILRSIPSKEPEVTAAEGWRLVRQALENGYYGYKEEFEKLPADCQKAIGNPEQLREWAVMETRDVEVTAAAHFRKSFETVQIRKERDRMLGGLSDKRQEGMLPVSEADESASPSLPSR